MMSTTLVQLDGSLSRLEKLAKQLAGERDQHVYGAALELRAAFDDRRAIEPAVARMRDSLRMLRRASQDASRPDLGILLALDAAVEHDLLPRLRQVGFDV